MGYTHYWNQKTVATAEQAKKVYDEIQKLMAALPEVSNSAGGYYNEKPIKLFGWNGTGEPVITENEIAFNGDGSEDLDHETFRIMLNKLNHDFCKTARKPYDLPVCLCLLSLKNNIPSFSLSSDGGKEDWTEPLEIYRNTIGPVTFK